MTAESLADVRLDFHRRILEASGANAHAQAIVNREIDAPDVDEHVKVLPEQGRAPADRAGEIPADLLEVQLIPPRRDGERVSTAPPVPAEVRAQGAAGAAPGKSTPTGKAADC